MNRVEFMKQLETLLQNISPAEREEALQYYNDYFDDAGPENEQTVIEALGNPAKVAENIKKDLYSNGYGDAANQPPKASDKVVMAPRGDNANSTTGDNTYDSTSNAAESGAQNQENKNKISTGMIVLIVVLCVLASPIIVSVASGLLGALTGIIVSWFALILGFGVSAIALFFVFLVLLVVGVLCVFSEPLVAVGVIGSGMLCGGIGILFMMLTVAMAGIATPAICKGITGLVKKLVNKNGR